MRSYECLQLRQLCCERRAFSLHGRLASAALVAAQLQELNHCLLKRD